MRAATPGEMPENTAPVRRTQNQAGQTGSLSRANRDVTRICGAEFTAAEKHGFATVLARFCVLAATGELADFG